MDTLTTTLLPFAAPGQFCGPPGIANGGWLSGQLASHLVRDGTGFPNPPVEVTLRRPTPVDRPLAIEPTADGIHLVDGEHLLASARLAATCPLPPAPVDRARAARAETAFAGWWDHPFPGCFVCGLRDAGAGLRLFTGPVDGRRGVVAGRWTVPPSEIPPAQLLWAALDCPTGWAHHRPGGIALLGRLTAQIHRPVEPGDELVVVARAGQREGRRLPSRCAIYDRESRLVAACNAVWIE